MEIRQCAFGHFYDASLHRRCPYCPPGSPGFSGPRVIPGEALRDCALPEADAGAAEEIQPVVGWLVCVSGPERGRGYALHRDNNFVGRGDALDVDLAGDSALRRDRPFVIAYDSRSRAFFCGLLNGCDMVRLNGTPLAATTRLNAGDRLELGRTGLRFVPLCGADFDWDQDDDH